MQFSGHLTGGAAAGAVSMVVVGGVMAAGADFQPLFDLETVSGVLLNLAAVFLITLFMALFPDLDTTSIPQKWFLRGVFVVLALLVVERRMDVFAVVAFATLLPMLHKHRGWTHWRSAPWLVSIFLAMVYEYFRTQDAWFARFSLEGVWALLKGYWPYILAGVGGHYTHLLLDSRRVRMLPFIKNPPGHH